MVFLQIFNLKKKRPKCNQKYLYVDVFLYVNNNTVITDGASKLDNRKRIVIKLQFDWWNEIDNGFISL